MNWLTLLCISQHDPRCRKPMALPSVEIPKENRFFQSGITRIDEDMLDETALTIDKDYPDLSFLGAGSEGLAYECKPGISCKITNDQEEAETAQSLIDNPCNSIVPIYEVRQIQDEPPLWIILMKKVIPLTNEEQYLYTSIIAKTGRKQLLLDNEIIEDIINRVHLYFGVGVNHSDVIRMDKLIREMNKSLEGCNIKYADDHAGNIGWDDGRLVLLDLG